MAHLSVQVEDWHKTILEWRARKAKVSVGWVVRQILDAALASDIPSADIRSTDTNDADAGR